MSAKLSKGNGEPLRGDPKFANALNHYIIRLRVMIMNYQYQGETIQLALPVDFVSINKTKVSLTDQSGNKLHAFNNKSDARRFVHWLTKLC